MASFGSLKSAIYDREERKQQYQAYIRGLNAYDRHKKFVNDYVSFYGKEKSANVKLPVKTDQDTLREGYSVHGIGNLFLQNLSTQTNDGNSLYVFNDLFSVFNIKTLALSNDYHFYCLRFIRTEEDDMDTSWEQRLVKRYYDKLFKEYCIADMSQYKSGKIGLRWRTEKEVISGKGQFICGNKHCDEKDGLASYEVNFSYFEAGENKQALVKLVTCERCVEKLNYKNRKEKEKLEKRDEEEHKRKRERSRIDDDSDNEGRRENRKKGKKASISGHDHKADDENFDEFLEGMFP